MPAIDPYQNKPATNISAGSSDKPPSEPVFVRIMAINKNKSGAAITMVTINGDDLPALIDTGAVSSMLSEDFVKENRLQIKELDSNIRFSAAGKTSLIVLGTVELRFSIGATEFLENFYVTRNLAHRVLIGGDIFWKHNMDVKFSTKELVIGNQSSPLLSSKELTQATITENSLPSELVQFEEGYLSDKETREIKTLIDEFADIFSKNSDDIGKTDFIHKIKLTDENPFKSRAYRIPQAQKKIVEDEIEKMLRTGVIKKSNSPWSSPVVLVKKKDGSIRFCVDYRKLNSKTIKDNYPMPYIDETLEGFIGKTHFSSIDLISGYWQFLMDPESQQFTLFVTHKGTFTFLRMPFGLCNAGATFQRAMEEMCEELPNSSAYIDDVVTASDNFGNHLKDLRKVFEKLRAAKLKVKPSKCKFGCSEIKFLGFIVSKSGISVCQSRSETIENYPRPKTPKQIQKFVGLINYYRKFIKDFSTLASPLTRLTKKKVPFEWSEECEVAFKTMKQCLINPPILVYPDYNKKFKITTDASNVGLGAILSQEDDEGLDRVIAYASRKLKPAEVNYSTTEQELLAIIYATEKFRPYIFGRNFELVTDHRPLTHLSTSVSKSERLTRWKLSLSEYSFDITYKPGKDNVNADVLSRVDEVCAINEIDQRVEFSDEYIRKQQRLDPEVNHWIRITSKNNGSHQKYRLREGILFNVKDRYKVYETQEIARLVIPSTLKELVLKSCHDDMSGAHLGVNKTTFKISNKFFWNGMKKDIKKWISSCNVCAGKKNPQPSKIPIHSITQPAKPFDMVGMDFIGPLTTTDDGNKHILVFTDYATRWVEAFPTRDQKASTVARILIDEIICRHSAPKVLLSDQGRNFMSEMIAEVSNYFNIKKVNTTSYHPQCNGLTEKFNDTLCKMLASYCDENQSDWDTYIPLVLFAYRTSIHKTTGETPLRLLCGRDGRLPIDIDRWSPNDSYLEDMDTIWKEAKANILKSAEYTESRITPSDNIDYKVGDWVRLNSPATKIGLKTKLRRDKWRGPYKIVNKNTMSNVCLDMDGKLKWVHISRIKIAETRTRSFRLSKPPNRLEAGLEK